LGDHLLTALLVRAATVVSCFHVDDRKAAAGADRP
jgi:hypothetical protein